MGMVLRVTPETLEKKAEEFSTVVTDIRTRFEQVQLRSSKTKGYWKGEAGERDRESYGSYKDDIRFILKRLEEHPRDLLEMAGIYRAAERDAAQINAQLKTDEIV